MMKPGVAGSGIDKRGHSHLGNPPETLKIGMFDKLKNQIRRNSNKSVNRIVYDFGLGIVFQTLTFN